MLTCEWIGGRRPPRSRQPRGRAGLGVRSDPNGRHEVCGFQPRDQLVQALQTYKDGRWRLASNGGAMGSHTKNATASLIMLPFCGSRRCILGGPHFGACRRHVEGISCGKSNHAKRRDRRKQLHHDRKYHDWNKYFQPPSHDYPQDAPSVLPLASLLVEITADLAVQALDPKRFSASGRPEE